MSADITDAQLQLLSLRWAEAPSPHLALQLADAYRQRGELGQALPILEEVLELHPDHVSIQVALGRYRLEGGDVEGAAEILRTVVDEDPGHLVANKLLVRVHLGLGDRKSAADRLELYALLNDNDPELEALRSAVAGELAPAVEGTGPPPLPEAFAPVAAVPGADLASLARPSREDVLRSVTGALDREPFAELGADPLKPGPLPEFLWQEAPEEVEAEAPIAELPEEPTPRPEEDRSAEQPAVEVVADAALVLESEEFEAAVVEPEAPSADQATPAEAEAETGATATLGALYLAQDHLADAERTFEQVLERDPDDAEAQAGMEEVRRRANAAQAVDAPAAAPQNPTIARLERYLSRIRAAAERLSA